MTSIYATTISSENFVIINNKTIELSGNIFMKKEVTINNGLLTTNSLIPNVSNSASLGSTSISWSNAYIRDVSVTNIELSGNIVPLNANSSRLGSSLKPWSNTYINDISVSNIELSGNMVPLNANSSRLGSSVKPWSNAYISDVSITNIELSGNIVPLNANKSSLGSSLKPWSNAYISDVSATNIELSGNIVPLNANKSSLGSGLKLWSNAYINDVSATNIELSGNIVPLNVNSSTLGSALKPWNNAYMSDVSVTNIELSGNIVPLNANSSSLGSSLKPWSNAYISDVSATNIDISGKLNVTGAVKISNSLEISGNVTFGGSTLYVPASFTIVPVLAPSPIELIVIGEGPYKSNPLGNDNNTGTVTINGNLVVQGETTSINSSVVDISDKMIVLASNASNAIQANGAGFEISGAKVNFLYNNSSATFNSSIGISISGNVLPLANGSIGQAGKVWSNAYISDVSVTTIELSGNIVPLNANSSRLGSTLKPWSNAYISDVSVTNIELSGNIVPLNANSSRLGSALKPWSNAYINDVSATNIELSGNIVPLNANRSTLGSALKPWSNAYISDVSVTNIELSGNMVPLNANSSRLGSALKQWSNAYINDVSVSNIELSGNMVPLNANSARLGSVLKQWSNAYINDVSVTNIELSGNIVPLNANSSRLGSALKPWSNAYINDISVTNIELSGNIVPLNANSSRLGSAFKLWSNVYMRDISVTNIEVSGNIVPLNANSSSLGSSLKRWNNIFVNDLSITNINGQVYSAGGGTVNLTSITSNIVPSTTNTYSLGSTTKYWSNAYIRDISVSNRVYQEISGDISWSAVNGHYGLAKDAYPSLNPSSSGVKAVQTWTSRTAFSTTWNSICWSPELGIFVAVAESNSNQVMTSSNGITWTSITVTLVRILGVCWSPQLKIFVAVSNGGHSGINCVATSSNGTSWTLQVGAAASNWRAVCWSAELRIFVAVSYGGGTSMMSSRDGITWTPISVTSNNWYSICWSPELGLFVAGSQNGIVMTSKNGTSWTPQTVEANAWYGICWSKELGLFVAVSANGINRVMTSPDGTSWARIKVALNYSWFNICWSPELRIFVAVAYDGMIMTSSDGINWSMRTTTYGSFTSVCWSPELGIFAAVADSGTRVITSSLKGRPPTSSNVFDGSFTSIPTATSSGGGATGWTYNAWTNDASTGLDSNSSYTVAVNLGEGDIATTVNGVVFQAHALSGTNFSIGGAVASYGSPTQNISGAGVALASNFIYNANNRTITLSNLTIGATYKTSIFSIGWDTTPMRNQIFTANNGPSITIDPNIYGQYMGIIINYTFVADNTGSQVFSINAVNSGVTLPLFALANRLIRLISSPTANIPANGIDETGKWTFANVAVSGTITAGGAGAAVTSDDRLKHNEVVINNGLAVIDKLCPKFYQKTLTMLDASYNGDLSGQAWNYEAGLIAQEVLQTGEINFVVSGGDYYESVMNYDLSINDLSVNDLSVNDLSGFDLSINDLSINDLSINDLSVNDLSVNDLSNNLIKKPYALNYNSIFTYGVAAIKELHTKVKAQETNILDQQLNSLITRIETLETSGVPIPNNEA